MEETTFTSLAERAAQFTPVMRRSQMKKICYLFGKPSPSPAPRPQEWWALKNARVVHTEIPAV
jgi:hypothetical protein